ncbi:hypothetical protein LSH36_131g03002 [Paralvinella palmiformis]|uniref:Uncharacterized protein n=1 Tax=Paralvinella palmiformis TaxID=53620 RepID=A0AAD9JWR8_9ANNE|nr:hypothetical protein LSH36_131g03002 [Paralvinella palmiformis]
MTVVRACRITQCFTRTVEYRVVDNCLSPMRDKCMTHEEYYYLGLDETFRFVCQEKNMADLVRCCTLCYLDTYLECTKEAVKSSCDTEAADWQYEVNRRYLAAMIKEFNCKINTSHRSTGVKVAIGLVITLAITNAIAIVIWLCRRRIINHVANVRARHIQHYSTQRNEDTSQDFGGTI